MTEEVQETLPIEDTPPLANPPTEPEVVAAEPEPAPEAEPEPPPTSKKPPKWMLDRLSEESNKARQSAERAEAAERRAREAEELLRRFNQPPGEHRQDPVRQVDESARQEEIRREAARMRFQDDISELNAVGVRTYGADFDNAVNVLASVTGQGDPLFEFVADVLSVDKAGAATLLHTLGSQPEEAVIFARMNSKQRIAALTRMAMAAHPDPKPAASAPATKQVSKAPAPAPALQPTAHKTINFQSPESDKLTDKEFFAQLDEHMQKSGRHARR